MKIPLNLDGSKQGAGAESRISELDILAAKKGDWNAKKNLARAFMPLLQSLAEKRTDDVGKINEYIEAGQEGVYKAARKYKPSIGASHFQVFALDFIQRSMDGQGKRSFMSRLFG